MIVFVVIVGTALGLALWFAGRPLWVRRRRNALLARPVPPTWASVLEERLPMLRRMPLELRQRLPGLMQIFIAEREFVGCNGLQVTEVMKVVIAAHACLLVLNRPGTPWRHLYEDLRAILIYPTSFIVDETHHHGDGLVTEGRSVLSGQAWDYQRILLSWEDIEHRTGGHNVMLHEFAHYLDMDDEVMDGAPGLGSKADFQRWSEVFWQAYRDLRADIAAARPTLLDPYAATQPAEFFAVVTEVFFERPRELASQHPALYVQLRSYYRMDPAAWES